jgi:hypothetical protein
MTCKLCGNDSELQKSHIIPEFFYKDSYDQKGRAHRFLSSDNSPKTNVYEQKGLREKLLCKTCEGIINDDFERDFHKFWYQNNNSPSFLDIEGITTVTFNPDLLKGLLLSILWRASIAEGDYFKSVSLGKKHETQIRNIIRKVTPISHYSNYKVIGSVITDDTGLVVKDLVTMPTKISLSGNVFYSTIFGGVEWMVKVSSHDAPDYSALFMDDTGMLQLQQKHFRNSIAKIQP